MISNDMLLNSKGFKNNNLLNSVLGGLFLILLFLPFPVYEGAGIFALMILISVSGFYEIFEAPLDHYMYGRILLILLFTLFFVTLFFQIYNLVIQNKTNLKNRIKNKYLLFSILQVLYYIIVLLIVKAMNELTKYNIVGLYFLRVSNVFTIYSFMLLAVSLIQLIHYILILKKLKKEQKRENLQMSI